MSRSTDRKHGVLLLDTRTSTPEHEHSVHLKLAERLATLLGPGDNRALAACAEFAGDVLLVESEQDDYVPHNTLMSYRSAFISAHSLTHRLVDGADHALSSDRSQKAYSAMLTTWVSERVIGVRLDRYPHHSPWHS